MLSLFFAGHDFEPVELGNPTILSKISQGEIIEELKRNRNGRKLLNKALKIAKSHVNPYDGKVVTISVCAIQDGKVVDIPDDLSNLPNLKQKAKWGQVSEAWETNPNLPFVKVRVGIIL